MSEATPPVAPAVTDANPSAAVANAADEADNHTPASPVKNDPPTPAADPTDGEDRMGKLEKIVGDLADSVNTLINAGVNAADPDTSPSERVPWTHRGGKR